nr:MAG TPA: hypothetical protein [Caudoviricetes sp.]
MSLFQKVKDFFSRGRYYMQTSNLNSILEHPKIADEPISESKRLF